MGEKSLIVKARLVKGNLRKIVFDDFLNLVDDHGDLVTVVALLTVLRVYKMQGDKPGFIYRKLYLEGLIDLADHFQPVLVFLFVKLLDVQKQDIFQADPSVVAVHRSHKMIAEGEIDTVV